MDISKYKILIADGASECIEFAAKELRTFLHKCTDINYEVCKGNVEEGQKYLSVGRTGLLEKAALNADYKGLKEDGFFIKVKDGNVFIDGNHDRSVLYGVYDFLETFFGVRFFARDCTYTPFGKAEIPDAADRYEVPAFEVRAYMGPDNFDKNCDQDFQARSRTCNSFTPMDKKHGFREWFSGRNNSTHNFNYYVPYEVYGKTHPEFYYSKKQGGIDTYNEDGTRNLDGMTICLSNGITDDGKLDESMEVSVLKVVIEEMKKDIVAKPGVKYFSFDQEDVDYGCECERCKAIAEKYKRSGLLIRFCNVLADELQKFADEELGGREINIVTFAYSYSQDAPVKEDGKGNRVPIDETVIPRKNVIIRLAIMCNHYYSVFDERQPEDIKLLMKDWFKVGHTFMYWGYDIGFDRTLRYFPTEQNIAATVNGLLGKNFIHVLIEAETPSPGGWQPLMKGYAYNKLFWNPKLDPDELLEEFRYHYFGEIGSNAVKRFMKVYQDFYATEVEKRGIMFRMFKNYKDPENLDLCVLEESLKIIEQAEEEVGVKEKNSYEKQKHLSRLAQVKCTPLFCMLENFGYYYPEKSRDDYVKLAKEFLATCKSGNVGGYHAQQDRWTLEKLEFEDDYNLPY